MQQQPLLSGNRLALELFTRVLLREYVPGRVGKLNDVKSPRGRGQIKVKHHSGARRTFPEECCLIWGDMVLFCGSIHLTHGQALAA